MSFYATSLRHPSVVTQKSGQTTAGSDWAALGDSIAYAPTGIWVRNDHASDALNVRNVGSDNGLTIPAGESRFFPIEFPSQLEVQRGGSEDIAVTWYLT